MSKLKAVRDSLPIIHSKNIIDDEELLLLFKLNCPTYLDLSYWSYESFDPDPWSEDESKSKLRCLTANRKSLVNILWLHDVLTYNNTHVEWVLILLKVSAYSSNALLTFAYQSFVRPIPQLFMISNVVLDFLFNNWVHLFRTIRQNWLSQQLLEHFANMVYDKRGPVYNCWGFVDGTMRDISHPDIHKKIYVIVIKYIMHWNFHQLWHQTVSSQIYIDH